MNLKDIGNKNVDITKELPTVLSLCSGYAGIERGLELAGFEHRTVAFVEIEAYAIARLANKMEAGELLPAPIWSNLKTLPVEPFRDRVDLLTGGYPCQPFSAAGKRKGEEDPRHLWPHIREIVRAVRPVRCFFENVEGHITLGLREVISDLESLGYKTAWGIFSAREVGAPHQRKRVYILADSESDGGRGTIRSVSSQNDSVRQPQEHRKDQSIQLKYASKNGASAELADRDSVRCDGGELSDRTGERSVEIEALQRPEQSLVRSEAERCRGDSGENELADSLGKRLQGGEWLQSNPCKISAREKSANGTTAKCSHDNQQGQWEVEPRLGRVVDGSTNRVDRLRLLGNGVVPQTAAKAWTTLNNQIKD